jgi:hypothetical protein
MTAARSVFNEVVTGLIDTPTRRMTTRVELPLNQQAEDLGALVDEQTVQRRASPLEVASATMDNTRREGDGFVFTLSHSKTNQSGVDRADNAKPIVCRAAQALAAWQAAAKITSGAGFGRVRRGGVIRAPLSPAGGGTRCLLAGLDARFAVLRPE